MRVIIITINCTLSIVIIIKIPRKRVVSYLFSKLNFSIKAVGFN